MRRVILILPLLLACPLSAASIAVVNSSFELSAAGTPWTGNIHSFYAPSGFYGWSVTNHSVDIVNGTYWAAEQGSWSVDLNGASAGTMSQTIGGFPRAIRTC